MQFEFKEETDEFAFAAACVARAVQGELGINLLNRMIDTFTASEMVAYHKFYEELTFSRSKY